jgi:molybdopterin/thiamine biosynthesis adenylyltransferase
MFLVFNGFLDMSLAMKVGQSICGATILPVYVAMKKMAASNVLIVGVQGLGVEIGTVLISSLINLI